MISKSSFLPADSSFNQSYFAALPLLEWGSPGIANTRHHVATPITRALLTIPETQSRFLKLALQILEEILAPTSPLQQGVVDSLYLLYEPYLIESKWRQFNTHIGPDEWAATQWSQFATFFPQRYQSIKGQLQKHLF